MTYKLLLVALGTCVATTAMAAVEDCPDPTAEPLQNVPGAVQGLPGAASSKCEPVDYGDKLGPDPSDSTLVVSATTVKAGTPQQPAGAPQPEEADEAGGIQTNYNNLQLARLGELDAMQGHPLNMKYADDLGYLQGYTRGQQRRAQGPAAGQQMMPPPGARRLW